MSQLGHSTLQDRSQRIESFKNLVYRDTLVVLRAMTILALLHQFVYISPHYTIALII